MFAYIGRRLGILLVILFGSSFMLFNLEAISGDPLAELRISTDPKAAQQILVLTRELNLDTPPPLRYFIWLKGILKVFVGKIDFGMTRDSQSVAHALAAAIPVTLRLVTLATFLAIILGIMLGIITALRQYSRFDYSMTFVSFLLYSLPSFWVAVLLKQYLAIEFNNFLENPKVSWQWLLGVGVVSGVFWSALLSGSRKRVATIFAIAGLSSAGLLEIFNLTNWFNKPGMGPIVIFALGIGIAIAVTSVSIGIENRKALYASLSMPVIALVLYYPVQYLFDHHISTLMLLGLFVATIVVAIGVSVIFAKIDRGPTIRTTVITSFLISILFIIDKLMQTWAPYAATDAVNNRPIPTFGQINTLLERNDFWMNFLDTAIHLLLPTLALTLISFAGYIRYSRGTLLEVLNQDYIRTARAKGLSERTVIMRHAFRNTLIPLTTIVVVDIAGIIGGAIITERVFGWTGMGTLSLQAINSFDSNLLMGVFFITGTFTVLANLVADLAYTALDPRIRVGGGK